MSEHNLKVGIVSSWGNGKTSFLNLFKLEAEKIGYIVIKFNPRASKNVCNIQEDFFRCFSEEIAKYHLGFNFIMNRYIRALGLQEQNSLLKGVANSIELVFSFNEKESVNDAIKSIGKRICVMIDDLDRLTGDEILEVFKLIDLNGDFNNTIFLSAYDKKYVNDVLKNHLGYQAYNYYTDKYFSYEITLTESLYDKLSDLAEKYIKERFSDEETIFQEPFTKVWADVKNAIIPNLGSLRHIKRYVNMSVERDNSLHGEVRLRDFLLLTLLKYKDYYVYNALFLKRFIIKEGDFFILKDSYKDELKNIATWEYSGEIMRELFPLESVEELVKQTWDNTYKPPTKNFREIKNYYCSIYEVASFHLYFQEPIKGAFCNKDMLSLFKRDKTHDALFDEFDEIISKNHNERLIFCLLYICDTDFIKDKATLNKLVLLLARIIRGENIISVKFILFEEQKLKEVCDKLKEIFTTASANKYIEKGIVSDEKDYKANIDMIIPIMIYNFPDVLGLIFNAMIEENVKDKSKEKKYIYNREELISKSLECQREYYKSFESNTLNIDKAFKLAEIIEDKSKKIVGNSLSQLFDLMQSYPDEIGKELIKETTEGGIDVLLDINFRNVIGQIFSLKNISFDNWVDKRIKNDKLKFLLKVIYRECDPKNDKSLDLPIDDKYKKGDIDYLYE